MVRGFMVVIIWGRVRQALISTCGEAIDRNWFSKLEAVEGQDKNKPKEN